MLRRSLRSLGAFLVMYLCMFSCFLVSGRWWSLAPLKGCAPLDSLCAVKHLENQYGTLSQFKVKRPLEGKANEMSLETTENNEDEFHAFETDLQNYNYIYIFRYKIRLTVSMRKACLATRPCRMLMTFYGAAAQKTKTTRKQRLNAPIVFKRSLKYNM